MEIPQAEALLEHHRVVAIHSGVQDYPAVEGAFQFEHSENFLLDVAAERSLFKPGYSYQYIRSGNKRT
jgi:hypothetical protein